MALLRSNRWYRPLLLGFALALGGAPLGAQESGQALQEWTLQNIRAAWCVHFLMDSVAADKELPREYRPVRAAAFPSLSPAISHLVAGEPEFQAWVPALWCSFYSDQVKIGDQVLGDANPEPDKRQYLGVWLIGAAGSRPGEDSTPAYYMATLRSPNWRMIRLAETSLIRVEHAEPAMGKVPEHSDDRYRVAMGKTIITWDGHLAGDSAGAAPAVGQIWLGLNSRGARIRGSLDLRAEKRQNVAGSLQIAGNDDLAKSLRASPIRMVGPISWGGTGTLTFSR